MDEIPAALIEAAVREIQSIENETGESLGEFDAEVIVSAVLGLFEIREEFRCMTRDGEGAVPDEALGGRLFATAQELAEAMETTDGSWREMQHRFVADTDWTRIRARIEWEDA